MLGTELMASTSVVSLLVLPFALQTGTMMVDEFHFHRERGLPLWERIGHPLDTLTVVLCYGFLATAVPSGQALSVFVGLALFSILFTAKDEPIHARLCRPEEHRTHLILFALHPLVLGSAGLLWWLGTPMSRFLLLVQGAVTTLFMIFQFVYWNLVVPRQGFGHAAGQVRDQ